MYWFPPLPAVSMCSWTVAVGRITHHTVWSLPQPTWLSLGSVVASTRPTVVVTPPAPRPLRSSRDALATASLLGGAAIAGIAARPASPARNRESAPTTAAILRAVDVGRALL